MVIGESASKELWQVHILNRVCQQRIMASLYSQYSHIKMACENFEHSS